MKILNSILALTAAVAAGISIHTVVWQGGTWTVQPGNTANTTAWKVDGSAVTQPVTTAPKTVTITTTTPTVANTTSVTILAANSSRKSLEIYNGTSADIAISPSNATLTGIAPTATNFAMVIHAGQGWVPPVGTIFTGAVTCYQSSGGSVNTIVVMEGQ